MQGKASLPHRGKLISGRAPVVSLDHSFAEYQLFLQREEAARLWHFLLESHLVYFHK